MTGPEIARDAASRRGANDFLAGLVIFLVSLGTLISSVRMPFYGDSGALGSPGLTPGLVSLMLLVLSAGLMLRSRRYALRFGRFEMAVDSWRVLTTFAIVFVYVAVMPWIHYVPATFIMLLAFQVIFARKRNFAYLVVWGVGLSAALTACLWYLFAEIFFVPLP